MKYPHHELLIDWLGGATIQYEENGIWVDCPTVDVADKVPHLYRTGVQYRRKPVQIRWHLAVMRSGALATASNLMAADRIEADPLFKFWLTDWHVAVL